jgi:hypothetical protein
VRTLAVGDGYTLLRGTENVAENYRVTRATLDTSQNAEIVIRPKPVTVSATPQVKTYDATTASNQAVRYDPADLLGSARVGASSQAFVSADAAPETSIEVTGFLIDDGNDGANYAVTRQPAIGAIEPKTVTARAAGDNKVYDGNTISNQAVLYDPAELLAGARVASAAQAFDSPQASETAAIRITDFVVDDGRGGANYTVVRLDGTGVIAPKPLTVTANADRRRFTGRPYSGGNGVVVDGFIDGESMEKIEGTLAYTGSSQGAILPGSFLITPTGLSARNYAVRNVSADLEIDRPVPPLPDNVTVAALTDALATARADRPAGVDDDDDGLGRLAEGRGETVIDMFTRRFRAGPAKTGQVALQIVDGGLRLPEGIER